MDAGEPQKLLQWGIQKPQQDQRELLCDTHLSGDTGQSLEQVEGLPRRAGSWSPLTPRSWRGWFVDSSAVTSLGDVGFRSPPVWEPDPSARQRLSTPAKECERLRRPRGSCQGHPCRPGGLSLPLSSPGEAQSLQLTLWRALGTAHQLPVKWSQRGFSLSSHFSPHPKKGLFFSPWGGRGRNRLLRAGECRAVAKPGEGGCREAAETFPSSAKQKMLHRQGLVNHRTFQA